MHSKVMSRQAHTRLSPELRANVKLWRNRVAWMDIGTTCKVIVVLVKALQLYKETHQVVFGAMLPSFI